MNVKAATQKHIEMEEIRFDLQGLSADLMGQMLSFQAPVMRLEGPIFSERNIEILESSGLSIMEVETITMQAVQAAESLVLAKFLQKRRR